MVENSNEELIEIVVPYDMTIDYKDFLIPFLKMGVIEDCLKAIVDNKNLVNQRNKKAEQLTFVEYKKIFDCQKNRNITLS